MPRKQQPCGRTEREYQWRTTPGLPIVAVCSNPECGCGFVWTNPSNPDLRCCTCGAPIVALAEPIQRPAPTTERP